MSLFKKRDEPVEVDKKVIHDIRKELRPEYNDIKFALVTMEKEINDMQLLLPALRSKIYDLVTNVDRLLERLEE